MLIFRLHFYFVTILIIKKHKNCFDKILNVYKAQIDKIISHDTFKVSIWLLDTLNA